MRGHLKDRHRQEVNSPLPSSRRHPCCTTSFTPLFVLTAHWLVPAKKRRRSSPLGVSSSSSTSPKCFHATELSLPFASMHAYRAALARSATHLAQFLPPELGVFLALYKNVRHTQPHLAATASGRTATMSIDSVFTLRVVSQRPQPSWPCLASDVIIMRPSLTTKCAGGRQSFLTFHSIPAVSKMMDSQPDHPSFLCPSVSTLSVETLSGFVSTGVSVVAEFISFSENISFPRLAPLRQPSTTPAPTHSKAFCDFSRGSSPPLPSNHHRPRATGA